MEPMSLGSAPSSPASPGVNPNFLPNFLMGEVQPATPNPSTSPGRNRNSGNFVKIGMSTTDPRSLRQKLFNQSLGESPIPTSPYNTMSEKAGPPKLGLFDTLDQKKKPASPIMSSTVAHLGEPPVGFNESISRINEDSLNYSRNMYTMNDSLVQNRLNTSQLEKVDSSWVTVYGFPPSALTLVLTQLANCGFIVDKKVPSQGNWIHVKFNSIGEVSRVLALNGRCINNSLMIGVKPYYNKDNKENDNSVYTSPMRARSLRQSFISPQSPNSVLPPQNVPQKSTGIVTKTMEYVFGW